MMFSCVIGLPVGPADLALDLALAHDQDRSQMPMISGSSLEITIDADALLAPARR